MKTLISLLLLASAGSAFASEYKEIRELSLDAGSAELFDLDVTSGYLSIQGNSGIDQITVKATIRVETGMTFDEDDAKEYLDKYLILKLEERNDVAKLHVEFDHGNWSWGNRNGAVVDLDIQVPASLSMHIDDGSGWILVEGMSSDLTVDDGSGDLDIRGHSGKMHIDDGSGSINIANSHGGLSVDDGSGSVLIKDHQGDVYVEDGSGNIDLENITGSVRIDDGSGSIFADGISNDLIILDAGSGSVNVKNVSGEYINHDDRSHRRKNRDLM